MRKFIGAILIAVGLVAAAEAQAQTRTRTYTLTWKDNADNDEGTRVYRNGQKILELLGANLVSAEDTVTGVVDQEFCYEVSAFNKVGESAKSNRVCVVMPDTLPAAPTELQTAAVSASAIELHWRAREPGADAQRLTRARDREETVIHLAARQESYLDINLRRNTEYCYDVRALIGPASSGSYGRSCARTFVK